MHPVYIRECQPRGRSCSNDCPAEWKCYLVGMHPCSPDCEYLGDITGLPRGGEPCLGCDSLEVLKEKYTDSKSA